MLKKIYAAEQAIYKNDSMEKLNLFLEFVIQETAVLILYKIKKDEIEYKTIYI